MKRVLVLVATLSAACSSDGGTTSHPDSATPDFATPDFATPDFATPDLATPDLATPDLLPIVFTPPTCQWKVNTNTDGTVNPFISPAKNDHFYVSYAATPGNLLVSTGDAKACTGTTPIQVNKKAGEVYFYGAQSVNSDAEGNFYAVWESQPGSNVGFALSTDGMTFTNTSIINSTSQNGVFPAVAFGKVGEVHAVWSGLYQGEYDPFYSRNDTALSGGVFKTAVRVVATKNQDDETAVAVDGAGNVYVGWASFDGDVFVARSTNQGQSWSAPAQVNDVTGKAHVGIGSFMIVLPDGTVHVAWSDTRGDPEGNIYSDTSPPGASLAFGNDIMVNDNVYRTQEDASLAVAPRGPCEGFLYATWQDLRSNKSYDIYGTRSTDGGQTWEPNVVLTPSTDGDQMNPAIAANTSCQVGIAWRDSSKNPMFDVDATFVSW